MIIRKYGIELHRLTEDDIELVRQMRNKESIRKKMFFQKEITPEEQKEWFKTINNIYHYYFIIVYKNEKIGLINGKVLSFEKREAEGGMFIWDEVYLNSHIPVVASICLADLTFFIMKMEYTKADVRIDNEVAISYNQKLGYTISSEDKKNEKIHMILTRDNYMSSSEEFRRMVKKISNDPTDLNWDDIQLTDNQLELYSGYPDFIQSELNKRM